MSERALIEEGPGEAPLVPVDPLLGRTLDGRYRIERVLGEGGMGIVYKAVHTTLGKPLAIKVLRPEVSKNEEILLRFRQEAQSASQIGNPHIIDISDFGTLPDGSTYFAMEFLGGQSLATALTAGPFDMARSVHVVRQLAGALSAAHEVGIVHRDLKPDNVQLIERGGQKDFVKVLDFGIAKVGGSTSKLTQAGQVFGTPHYMSPEQCAGNGVDARTDIYAVGVILYEMTCGKVPFDADNLMGILTKHLYENPAPPTQRAPGVPISAALEAIVLKCLQKKAEERYQTMAELAADLDALDRGDMPKAAREPTGRTAIAGLPGPQTLTGVEARVTMGAGAPDVALRKSKAPLYIGALAAVALAAGGVWFTLGVGGRSADQPLTHAAAEPNKAPPPAASAVIPQPTAAEPEPAAPAPQLTVKSNPEHAEVYVDGSLVGNTPYAVSKPSAGKPLSLQLRLPGYQSKTVELSERSSDVLLTLQKQVEAPLPTPAKVATPTRPRSSEPTRPKPAAPAKHSPAQTEVLDPWN